MFVASVKLSDAAVTFLRRRFRCLDASGALPPSCRKMTEIS
jgi:hypothetical protein